MQLLQCKVVLLCAYFVFIETGTLVAVAFPIHCAMSSNKMSEAGNWPDTIGTYFNDYRVPDWQYYRLRCEFINFTATDANVESGLGLFRVYRKHWKRPFLKEDCELAGCNPVIWNSDIPFTRGHPIIDVYWYNAVQFATTAPHLKICEVPNMAPVIFTTTQLNDPSVCQESGVFKVVYGSIEELARGRDSEVMVNDFFMHVSSDVLSKEEMDRVNQREHATGMIDKDCSAGYRFRDGCDIIVLTSPFSSCSIEIVNRYYTARPFNGLEVTEVYDDSTKLVAYQYRITSYKMFSYAYSNLSEGTFFYNPDSTSLNANFVVRCRRYKPGATAASVDLLTLENEMYRGFSIRSIYWPKIYFVFDGEVKRVQKNFHFSKNFRPYQIDVAIISSNAVRYFQVEHTDRALEDNEVLVGRQAHYSHNHTTVYTLTFLKLDLYIHLGYKIIYAVNEIDLQLTETFYLTLKEEIKVMANPMEIAVVHGDRSIQPYFLCLVAGFPRPKVTWSKEIGPLKARQTRARVSKSPWLPKKHVGVFLLFPPATNLTSDYSGEYTCTAFNRHLITKRVTTTLIVYEPGSFYSQFYKHWIPIRADVGDIDVTDEEKSFFDCLVSPTVSESGRNLCSQYSKEVLRKSLIAISASVLSLAAILLGIVLIYRWHKRRSQLPDDSSSDENGSTASETSTSGNEETD